VNPSPTWRAPLFGASLVLIPVGAAALVAGGVLFTQKETACTDHEFNCFYWDRNYRYRDAAYDRIFFGPVRKYSTLSEALMIGGAAATAVGVGLLLVSLVGRRKDDRAKYAANTVVAPWASWTAAGITTTVRF
jgi:hypothetical protein